MATPYKINIPLYEGPLDLLLDLIRKQEMNIHDIPIAKITSQYLDYLHKLEELDVDVSADFVYMAATLIYIKSKMLLPPDPLGTPEEQAIDPRADLVQRLVEHEKFKNAAQLLYQKQHIEENVWSKPDKTLYNDEGTEADLVVSLVDLVKVFQQVLERRKEVSRIELQHEQFTVAQMMAQLRAQIVASEDSTVSLIALLRGLPVAARDDRGVSCGPGNGEDAGRRACAGKAVRRNRGEERQILRRRVRRKRRDRAKSTRSINKVRP